MKELKVIVLTILTVVILQAVAYHAYLEYSAPGTLAYKRGFQDGTDYGVAYEQRMCAFAHGEFK